MDTEKINKIRVPSGLHAHLQNEEAELVELLQAGDGTPAMRNRLAVIQDILSHAEIDPTWVDGPTPPEAA